MQKKKTQPSAQPEAVQKADSQMELKNQNPNREHNSKKVALGPNTKR